MGRDAAVAPAAAWGIVGHQRAVGLLRQSVATGRVSHAYLISGPRQVGKTTLALTFARALNCTGAEHPCGGCRTCRLIAKGVHPDVRLLRLGAPEGNGGESSQPGRRRGRDDEADRSRRGRVKNISIDDLRAMLRDVALAPYEARWKVYVIRYAEDLSLEGIQILLKTLEEPPEHVVLTLTAADAKMLPPTVVSRCQQVSLGLVSAAEIAQGLQERFAAQPAQAKLLAHLSGGRAGWAIGALENPALVEARAERLDALLDLAASGRVERLVYAEQLAAEFGREPEAVVGTLELWLAWWRDILLVKNDAVERVLNYDRQRQLQEYATRFHAAQLVAAMQAIRTALQQLQQNANPRLALEVLLLSVPTGARG